MKKLSKFAKFSIVSSGILLGSTIIAPIAYFATKYNINDISSSTIIDKNINKPSLDLKSNFNLNCIETKNKIKTYYDEMFKYKNLSNQANK